MNRKIVRLAAIVLAVGWAMPAVAQTCPTSGDGITCFGGQYYCSANKQCYDPPASCPSNKVMSCSACGCVCPGGTTWCASSRSLCTTNQTCPPGLTWNPCTESCSTPYVLLSPPSAQSGGISVTGDIMTGGDVYLPDGKAVRVDGSGTTMLNLGNWDSGATGLFVNTKGTIGGNGFDNTGGAYAGIGGIFKGDPAVLAQGPGGAGVKSVVTVRRPGTLGSGLNEGSGLLFEATDAAPEPRAYHAVGRISGIMVDPSVSDRTGALVFETGSLDVLSEKMRIMPDGSVGIGTASPAQKLDVVGTVQATGFKMPTGAGAGKVLVSDASGVAAWQDSAGGISGSGTANHIPKWTSATALGNSLVFDNGTNVGVGTATPAATDRFSAYTEDTSGTASTVKGIYSQATNTGVVSSGTDLTYGVYSSAENSASHLGGTIRTYGGYFTALGSSGGTSTAYGTYSWGSSADTSYGVYGAGQSQSGETSYGVYGRGYGGGNTNYGVYGDASSGLSSNIGVEGYAAGGGTTYGVRAQAASAANNYGVYARAQRTDSTGTNYALYAEAVGAAYNWGLYVNAGESWFKDNVYMSGYVGVGMQAGVAPPQRLTVGAFDSASNEGLLVQSNANAFISLSADNDNVNESHNSYVKFSQDGGLVTAIVGQVGSGGYDPEGNAYVGSASNALLLGTITDHSVQLGAGGTVGLTLNSSGNVSVVGNGVFGGYVQAAGVTSTADVTATGNVYAANAVVGTHPSYGSGYAALWKVSAASYAILASDASTYVNAPTDNVYFRIGNSNKMTLDSTGEFGIGTTPAYKLHVVSSGAPAAAFVRTTSDGTTLWVEDTDGSCRGNPESSSLVWTCSSDARLKTDVVDTGDVLGRLANIRIRDYKVKASGDHRTGVIAQEYRESWPELVTKGEDGYLSVAPPSEWQVIKGIQELATAMNSTLKLDPKGGATVATLTVTGDVRVPNNKWGDGSGWLSCPAEGECACPGGMFVTKTADRGARIYCSEL